MNSCVHKKHSDQIFGQIYLPTWNRRVKCESNERNRILNDAILLAYDPYWSIILIEIVSSLLCLSHGNQHSSLGTYASSVLTQNSNFTYLSNTGKTFRSKEGRKTTKKDQYPKEKLYLNAISLFFLWTS